MGKHAGEHHVEISFGRDRKTRLVKVDGRDITSMLTYDGVDVEFTETGPIVTLTTIPKWLDITLDGTEVRD